MKLDMFLINKWRKALESGKYKQTTGTLHRTKYLNATIQEGYCCLGVLCEVAGLKSIPLATEGKTTFLLPDKRQATDSLRDGDFGLKQTHIYQLMAMNDGSSAKQKTFHEIAEWIKTNIKRA